MESNLLLGLGLAFGIALFLTVLSEGSLRSFVMFLVISVAIFTWASLLEPWTLILTVIGGLITVYLEFKTLNGNGTQI